MSLDGYIKFIRRFLPSPFAIAICLTLVAAALVFSFRFFTTSDASLVQLGEWWSTGLWNTGLLAFAVQMMLMLVLGYVLALSPPVSRLIRAIASRATSASTAVVLVSLFAVLTSLFNWGLGLICGAILAREVGQYALSKGIPVNYPLLGAAGYSGLMVWHGGLSGSSLLKVAEPNHLRSLVESPELRNSLPESLSMAETFGSGTNLFVLAAVLVTIPLCLSYIAKRLNPSAAPNMQGIPKPQSERAETSAEKLDRSWWFSGGFGIAILLLVLFKIGFSGTESGMAFFNPNNLNLTLLSLCLLLHPNLNSLLTSLDQSMSSAGGILIQFPLYFGIMGLMQSSGLVSEISSKLAAFASAETFPMITFFSAGLVNIFVPSGGGQWVIQGPIILEASQTLNIPLSKGILAMAYGDQLTNMLQPFWALPLLGITKLSAREILPYTLLLFLLGLVVFSSALLIF